MVKVRITKSIAVGLQSMNEGDIVEIDDEKFAAAQVRAGNATYQLDKPYDDGVIKSDNIVGDDEIKASDVGEHKGKRGGKK